MGGGEGHRWFLQLCSLSAGGYCGLFCCHYSSHTRQWCSWSARSQWFPCRKWWWWVEGDLLFSAGREKCRHCCAFLESDMLLVVQVRYSVMCTPRNLVVLTRAVRLIEIEIKSRFEIARFLNRFIARFFSAPPAPTSRSMLSEPIRMQQNRTDRAYRQIVC